MERRAIGRSGLGTGRLGLGTLAWGLDVDEDGAGAMVRALLDLGGGLLDTAPWYAAGASEAILASVLGTVVDREDVVVCGKGGLDPRTGPAASRRAMLRQLDACLSRLGTDHLDLWLWQGVDHDVPMEETLAALEHAVVSGRVAYVGVANQAAWRVALASSRLSWPAPLVAAQAEYSLVSRQAEAELVPACTEVGAALIGWSALGRGVLAGGYRAGLRSSSRAAGGHLADFVRPRLDPRSRRIAEAVATAAQGLDRSPAEVAVSWALARPGVTAVLVGPRTVDQLVQCAGGAELHLPAPITAALDEVSSAP
ncbi:MAG: aldo/keto reductase [Kineosporiaceae bacterium]